MIVGPSVTLYKRRCQTASGELLTRKTYAPGGALSETKDFIGNYEFINNVIEAINHSQGRYRRISTVFRHEYVLTDHVGSTRIVYADKTNNDVITLSDIIDENHYYSYGLEYTGSNYITDNTYPYKFNDERACSSHKNGSWATRNGAFDPDLVLKTREDRIA